jgi:ubiquitin C-terminal hydrolase
VWRDKITTRVDFPLDNLSLNAFIGNAELRNSDNFDYRLVAVSNHTGTMDGGHYTAVCRHSRRWFKFDDTNVKECDDLSSIVSSASYILFYSRF